MKKPAVYWAPSGSFVNMPICLKRYVAREVYPNLRITAGWRQSIAHNVSLGRLSADTSGIRRTHRVRRWIRQTLRAQAAEARRRLVARGAARN